MRLSKDKADRIREHHSELLGDRAFGVCGVMAKAMVAEPVARELTFIVNTDDVDADGEVVSPGGLDFSQFRRNGKVFLDHRYDFYSTIGSLRYVNPFPDSRNVRGWIMRMYVVNGMQNPAANDVLTAASEIGIGASIGFIPKVIEPPNDRDPMRYKTARAIIRSADVFEVSLTMMPANLACQQVMDHADEEEEEPMLASLGELVTKGRISQESAWKMGLPKRLAMGPRRLRMSGAYSSATLTPSGN